MKVLLVILCGVMLLFGGGCAIVLGNELGGPLVLIPLAVAVVNAILLAAIFGWSAPWRPAFLVMAVVDFFIAAATIIAFVAVSSTDPTVLPWTIAMAGGFGLKGVLTWRYVQPPPAA
jgi:hypothetical protein